MNHKHLFVCCPPFSGSTLLMRLLASSPNVAALPKEGQSMDSVKKIMRNDPWNPQNNLPWNMIKNIWNKSWDKSKPIFLENSPPNLIHAFEIEKHFPSSYFVLIVRNPYANCEAMRRGHHKVKGLGLTQAAENWVLRAMYQINNLKGLHNAIGITYESLIEETKDIIDKILEFMPELERIDINSLIKIKFISGSRPIKITSYNDLKISTFSGRDLNEINSVLKNYPEIMDYFGYQYINPSIQRSITRTFSIPKLFINKYNNIQKSTATAKY